MRNRRRSSNALSSDGFDFDDDAEMEEGDSQDAEDDVLNDEVCGGGLSLQFAGCDGAYPRSSYLGVLWLVPGTNNSTTFA